MSRAVWEKREHGDQCSKGHHLPYRIRHPLWVAVHCKLCAVITYESYEQSQLQPPKVGEAAA